MRSACDEPILSVRVREIVIDYSLVSVGGRCGIMRAISCRRRMN